MLGLKATDAAGSAHPNRRGPMPIGLGEKGTGVRIIPGQAGFAIDVLEPIATEDIDPMVRTDPDGIARPPHEMDLVGTQSRGDTQMTPSRSPIQDRDAVGLAIANDDVALRILRNAGHRRIFEAIFLRVTLPLAAGLSHIETGRRGHPQPAVGGLKQIEVPSVWLSSREIERLEVRIRRIGTCAVEGAETGRPKPSGAVDQDRERAARLETFGRPETPHLACAWARASVDASNLLSAR